MTTKRAGDGFRKARTALVSGIMIAVVSLSITPSTQAADSSDWCGKFKIAEGCDGKNFIEVRWKCDPREDCVDPGVDPEPWDPCVATGEDPDVCTEGLPPVDTYDPLELRTQCSKVMMLCVFAGAGMYIEGIKTSPNTAVHVTTGGGHNSHFILNAVVAVESTLGQESDVLKPDEGVGWSWSDISLGNDCKFDYVESEATGYTTVSVPPPVPVDYWLPIKAYVKDAECEHNG